MMEAIIPADVTFEPWYHGQALIIPKNTVTEEQRFLKRFARKCRVERIAAHVAASPSRSMWPQSRRVA